MLTPLRRRVDVGFCDGRATNTLPPGLDFGSWGYRSHDGNIVAGGEEYGVITPSSDFGQAGKFHAGDVVGVGLVTATGEGFITLNGERRNTGEMAPCVSCIRKLFTDFCVCSSEYRRRVPERNAQIRKDIPVHRRRRVGGQCGVAVLGQLGRLGGASVCLRGAVSSLFCIGGGSGWAV